MEELKCEKCGNTKEFYKDMIAEDIFNNKGEYIRTSVGEITSDHFKCMECDSIVEESDEDES